MDASVLLVKATFTLITIANSANIQESMHSIRYLTLKELSDKYRVTLEYLPYYKNEGISKVKVRRTRRNKQEPVMNAVTFAVLLWLSGCNCLNRTKIFSA